MSAERAMTSLRQPSQGRASHEVINSHDDYLRTLVKEPLRRIILKDVDNTLLSLLFAVTRLMGGSAGGSMGHSMNMSGLAACNVSDSKPMQFPLTQRRKRRVLFTQAQVSIVIIYVKIFFVHPWLKSNSDVVERIKLNDV